MMMRCNPQLESAELWDETVQIPGLEIFVDRFNQRLVVKELESQDLMQVVEQIGSLAREIPWLGKIIIFCKDNHWREYLASGYRLEGYMEGFMDTKPAALVTKYFQQDRAISKDFLQEDGVLEKIFAKAQRFMKREIPKGYIIRTPHSDDAPQMAELYKEVFELYPTPVKRAPYLQECMRKNYLFKVIEHKGRIISAASAEVDSYFKAAEITDCATSEDYRGQGLMYHLVEALEKEMIKSSVKTLFSLARAKSAGINSVLYRSGYGYRGRLTNNCIICSGFEDMNIWEKAIGAV